MSLSGRAGKRIIEAFLLQKQVRCYKRYSVFTQYIGKFVLCFSFYKSIDSYFV